MRAATPIAFAAIFVGLPIVGRAQAVELQMRPQLGDTLRLLMEQQIDMRGGSPPDSDRTMSAAMRVRARAVPLSFNGRTTTLMAITDSVVVAPARAGDQPFERVRRALEGRRQEVLVALDGAMDVPSLRRHGDEVSPLFGQMPAILPTGRVRPGASWERQMTTPIAGPASTSALVRAVFRLDSLSRDRRAAFISMRGTIERDPQNPVPAQVSGTISGTMRLDRRMGWISDSYTLVIIESLIPAPRGAGAAGAKAMRVSTRISQRLRAESVR